MHRILASRFHEQMEAKMRGSFWLLASFWKHQSGVYTLDSVP